MKKDSKNFGLTIRPPPGPASNLKTPKCTEYDMSSGPGLFGPPPVPDVLSKDPLYKPPAHAIASNLPQSARWKAPMKIKDKIGPGLYDPYDAEPLTTPSVRTYGFVKSEREDLANKEMVPGPGAYMPDVNSKGWKAIGKSKSVTSLSVDSLLNSTVGYKPRGFGVIPRFDGGHRKLGRTKPVPDEYTKKLNEATLKNEATGEFFATFCLALCQTNDK